MIHQPFISIIIVNYNGKQYLQDCFISIRNQNYPKEKFEIIMIDNSSVDNSIEFVRKNFSEVKIIKNIENNYAKANNIGIKSSKGEFIALLNNDTRVDENWLIELVKVIKRDKKIGGVTSKILFDDKKTIQSIGLKQINNFYWIDNGFQEKDAGQYNQAMEVEGLGGAAVLYNKKCLEDVGLFDENFVIYCEDVDLSLRCRNRGWKLFYAPKSIVYHKFRGTANLMGGKKFINKHIERNRLILIAKHYPEFLISNLYKSKFYEKKDDKVLDKDLKLILGIWFNTDSINKADIFSKFLISLNKDHKNLINSIKEGEKSIKEGEKSIKEGEKLFKRRESELKQLLQEKDRGLVAKVKELEELKRQEKNLQDKIKNYEEELKKIKSTLGWKILTKVHKIKKKVGLIK